MVDQVAEICGCDRDMAKELLDETAGDVEEAMNLFFQQADVERAAREKAQRKATRTARKRTHPDSGENLAGRVAGAARQSRRSKHDNINWGDWRLETAPSHYVARFDVRRQGLTCATPPLKIAAAYTAPAPHWRGANALIAHLCNEERERGWIPARIQVAAGAVDQATGAALSNDKVTVYTSMASLAENKGEAAYFMIFYGNQVATEVLQSGCPRGCIPACAQLTRMNRSLIVFVSCTPTFSGTHRDETPSLLHCVSGTKTVFLCPPDTHDKFPDLYKQYRAHKNWLDYDPFDDPEPPEHWKCCHLIPGESLFIPANWWHNVFSPVDTIGLSVDIARATPNDGEADGGDRLQRPAAVAAVEVL